MNNANGSFSRLSTNRIALAMRSAADATYQQAIPGCRIERLKGEANEAHAFDKEFGIDLKLHLPCGAWLSVQEKIRSFEWLKKGGDFTQEFKNAAGTEYESPGEWFKLGAQLYFYGWANQDGTAFEKWQIYNVASYKILVQMRGGLGAIGKLRGNQQHGRASFYGIPLDVMAPAVMASFDRSDSENVDPMGWQG